MDTYNELRVSWLTRSGNKKMLQYHKAMDFSRKWTIGNNSNHENNNVNTAVMS